MRLSMVSVYLLLLAAMPVFAADGDLPGAKDPPGIGQRFAGARIVHYKQDAFDAHAMATGKATARGKLAKSVNLEGRVTEVRYEIPAERTTVEVMRNYIDAFKAKGFDTLFACADVECGGRDFNLTVGPRTGGFQEVPKGQRYLAARKGDLYASVYVVKNYSSGGSTKNRVYVQVFTVETKPMDTKLVTVDAAAMEKAIDATGHVAVYGIQFDTDKDVPLASSNAAIGEIAKLLAANPKLRLHVVGHTDGQGKHEYNLGLSRRRAQSVVNTLVREHGVAADRLLASGVASLAPVASNATDEGRAKNRRVEIVAR